MDDALALGDYLPISFRSEGEEKYIAFLWDAFETNYQAGKYEFAGVAFHLLYMSFASFALWQIRAAREHDFNKALIGFFDREKDLLSADTPFKFFEGLKESQMFRFLRLLGCSNAQIGEFSKFVKRRNKIAHPSGTVFFNDRASIDAELELMMAEVANIQRHMRPIISDVYRDFLLSSSDLETREYSDPDEEIEVNLIHKSYFSLEDVAVCVGFNMATLADQRNHSEMLILHERLSERYGDERDLAEVYNS
jgi:hypothetical protein